MKKLSLFLVAVILLMSVLTLVSCEKWIIYIGPAKTTTAGQQTATTPATTTIPNNNTTIPTNTTPQPTTPTTGNGDDVTTFTTTSIDDSGTVDPVGDYTLGMGVTFDEFTKSEINMTLAAVVLDAEGRILACRIDAVQNKFAIDFDYEEVEFTRLETKVEMGDRYGMGGNPWCYDNNGDGRVLEWYQQAQAFEQYVVGMTAKEVAAMTTTSVNGRFISTDDALLSAGCTIQVTEFIEAVVKACNDEQAVHFAPVDTVMLGIAANSVDDGTRFDENG